MMNFVQLTGTDAAPAEQTAKDYVKLHGTPIPTSPQGQRLYVGQFSSQVLLPATGVNGAGGATDADGHSRSLAAQRDYALKTLLGATSAENSVVLWTRALKALPSHANVVSADGVAFDGANRASFIVMPYITSLNLREYRHMAFEQHRAISCDSLRRIVLDILCGLYHLQMHGIVHRNVHPGNIIVDISTGVTCVTDLSFSAVIHNGAGAVKASALAEKLAPESSRWADPALLAKDATAAATVPVSSACDIWGFGNVLHGLFCSGDLNPMTPYVCGTSPAITADSIDSWVGVEEADEEALQNFRRELADLISLCAKADPTARPAMKSLFGHPFIFPAVVSALQQSRAESAAFLYAQQQQAQRNQLRALFTGTWLEQFAHERSGPNAATEMWNWLSTGMAGLKDKVSEMMGKPTTTAHITDASAPIPVQASAPIAVTTVHNNATGAASQQEVETRPPHLLDINTPPTPLVIASPMGTRGFLTSARTLNMSVATFNGAPAEAGVASQAEKWPANYGLLFEVEVPTGVSIVRLQNICFTTCGDVWSLRSQLFWSPGALLTGPDAEQALRAASWMPVCKKPWHFHKVMAKHPLDMGPFHATFHQHGGAPSENPSNTPHASFGTRFTILFVTNYSFGVQRATCMATKHGSLTVPPARLNVGDELAAVGNSDLKLRVFAGVTCDAAVPAAVGGVLVPDNSTLDDGDEGDSDLEEQPKDMQDRRLSGDGSGLENFQQLRSEALGDALVEARRRAEAVGFCGSLRYSAH